jgi:hypothetical protein
MLMEINLLIWKEYNVIWKQFIGLLKHLFAVKQNTRKTIYCLLVGSKIRLQKIKWTE